MGVNNLDYSTLSVTNTAQVVNTACSPAMPTGSKGAVMTLETAQIRYRDDGTDPTATEGHILDIGDVLTFDSWTMPEQNWEQVLKRLRVIRTGATSGALKISWYD